MRRHRYVIFKTMWFNLRHIRASRPQSGLTFLGLVALILSVFLAGCRLDDNRLRGRVFLPSGPPQPPPLLLPDLSPQLHYLKSGQTISFSLASITPTGASGGSSIQSLEPIFYECFYDHQIDGQVVSGQDCHEIEGFHLNAGTGNVHWLVSESQSAQDFEFKVRASLGEIQEERVFAIRLVDPPVVGLSVSTLSFEADQQPRLALTGAFKQGQGVRVYSDPLCSQAVTQHILSEDSHSIIFSLPPLDPGEHSFYFQFVDGSDVFPCYEEEIAYSYNPSPEIERLLATDSSFVALMSDGSVEAWGADAAGDISDVWEHLREGVVEISVNPSAVAALKQDGSVWTWGSSIQGGNSSSVAEDLSSGVVKVFSTDRAFAALKEDGSVVTWGDSSQGGNSSSVAEDLSSGVAKIFSTGRAFAALKGDGSVVTWGWSHSGGQLLFGQWSFEQWCARYILHRVGLCRP